MPLSRDRLYLFLIVACLAGYGWLYLNVAGNLNAEKNQVKVCIIKQVTGIPCPSCGSTRSVLSIMKGDFLKALYWNPFGFILLFIISTAPIWVCYDYLTGKNSLYNFYKKTELMMSRRMFAIPSILIVLVNWAWNIYKDL